MSAGGRHTSVVCMCIYVCVRCIDTPSTQLTPSVDDGMNQINLCGVGQDGALLRSFIRALKEAGLHPVGIANAHASALQVLA